MNCNIVKDLIPLYIDRCCSKESALTVEEHMSRCSSCKELYKRMMLPCPTSQTPAPPTFASKLSQWKASILQSMLLFASFAMISAGVALEATTPIGPANGIWAVSMIIPATGLLLSLANWYFVRLYRNRKLFSTYSLLWTLGCTICGYVWSIFHYSIDFAVNENFPILFSYGIGIMLTTLFCALSKILSNQYAKMIGKE